MDRVSRLKRDEELRAELLAAGLSIEEGSGATVIRRADGQITTDEQLDFLLRSAFGVSGVVPPKPRPRRWWREAKRRVRDVYLVLVEGRYVD